MPRRRRAPHAAISVPVRLITTALALILAFQAPALPAAAQSPPPGLPAHFGWGLSAHPDDAGIYGWMPDSNIPWNYAYQYLAGGVNTGQGWETWSPNGTFALDYARGAAQRGYVPMFPYYEMLHSTGPCDSCPENQQDLAHLNSPQVMQAYFENFALLMKRLGPGTHDGIQGFGGAALVNIEPDLTGYAQQAVLRAPACFGYCTGEANNPSNLKAAVSSSGHADVAGYPDTFAGFNQALLHLRDLYAPNVLLGFDISMFATGQDIGLNSDPNLDAAAFGRVAGQFAALSGVTQSAPNTSTYDLLFNSPLDRDAGQYRVQFNQNRWWDRDNVTVPNFRRWEQYLSAARGVAGNKPILLWQVPVGNQYFRSVNNTENHYQDNRAEYFFAHVPELIQTGIIGVMFGGGNAGTTGVVDGAHDGVTNPPPVCSTDGSSSGQICNDHESTVSDDDGGYLRMAASAYYQAPVSLTAALAPATPAGPVPAPPAASASGRAGAQAPFEVTLGPSVVAPTSAAPDEPVDFSQELTASSDALVLVDFELYDAVGHKVWQNVRDNVPVRATVAHTETTNVSGVNGLAPGAYTLKTGVFSAGWGTLYAWNDAAGTLTLTAN